MAVREPLEVVFQPPRALRFRPPLSSLLPVADAVALGIVYVLVGFHPVAIVFAVLTFLILNSDSSRIFRINPRLGDDAAWLMGRVAVSLLLLMSVVAVAKLPLDIRAHLSNLTVIAPLSAIAVIIGRAAAYALGRAAKARGVASERTLIVGEGELAIGLAKTLLDHQEFGLRPVGFLGRVQDGSAILPFLGECTELDHVVHEHSVSRVLVAFGDTNDKDLATVLRASERTPAEIHVVPRFFELSGIPQGAAVDDVCGIPLFHLRRPALRSAARLEKRGFDLVGSTLLLLLTAPLLAIAALAVRVSSPGPILFRQKRVGLNGRIFEIVKFRTMRVNDDSDTAWFSGEDDRVTGVGRILRMTSIDELPQLLNVLRGEMSLVGPRPERPHYTDQFAATVSRYDDRHRVLGGITGWAQIHGRSRGLDAVPERARLDNYYIENWSVWRDLVIIVRTIAVLLRGDDG
ncbi:MAG: sugar transferase [Actinobacteria bacterium]|nr:MAG: sugar transferase [Actinomycetota bacterium]